MSKTTETKELEKSLYYLAKDKCCYGCEEVTIGFANERNSVKGDEIVDFLTMDSKGILRCYEIKVSLSDLKSKAKKSFYGHYNFLLIGKDLCKKIDNGTLQIYDYIPEYVGVLAIKEKIVQNGKEFYIFHEYSKPKKQNIDQSIEIMLKESLIRSMFYRLCDEKDANNKDYLNLLKNDIRHKDKMINDYEKKQSNFFFGIDMLKKIRKSNGKSPYFADCLLEEHEEWLAHRNEDKSNQDIDKLRKMFQSTYNIIKQAEEKS